MKKILLRIDEKMYEDITAEAKKMPVTISAYLRMILTKRKEIMNNDKDNVINEK